MNTVGTTRSTVFENKGYYGHIRKRSCFPICPCNTFNTFYIKVTSVVLALKILGVCCFIYDHFRGLDFFLSFLLFC